MVNTDNMEGKKGTSYDDTPWNRALATLVFAAGLAGWGVLLADAAGAVDLWDTNGGAAAGLAAFLLASPAVLIGGRAALRGKCEELETDEFGKTKGWFKSRVFLGDLLGLTSYYLVLHIAENDDIMLGLDTCFTTMFLLANAAMFFSDKQPSDWCTSEGKLKQGRQAIAMSVVLALCASFSLENSPDFSLNGSTADTILMAGVVAAGVGAVIEYVQGKRLATQPKDKIEKFGNISLMLGLFTVAVGAVYAMFGVIEQKMAAGAVYGVLAFTSGVTGLFATRNALSFDDKERKHGLFNI